MDNLQLAEIQEVESIEKEGFKIQDKGQAQWALRKISALQAQIDENKALAEKEIQRVKEWEESENKAHEDSIGYFTALLQEYMLKEKSENPGLKSIKLPHGTIRLRKQQPNYIREDEKLIEWAKKENRTELINVKESLKWGELKKEILNNNGQAVHKETGEVIEHIQIQERPDKFEVVVE